MKTHKLFIVAMITTLAVIQKIDAQNFFAPVPPVNLVTGDDNTAIGDRSMYSNVDGNPITVSGFRNTAVGKMSLNSISSGSRNTAIGHQAMFVSGMGSSNVAVGDEAGFGLANGHFNTLIGPNCGGQINFGVGNTFLGRVNTQGADVSNTIILADGGTQTSNFGTQRLYINNVGRMGVNLGNNPIVGNNLEITSVGAVPGTTGLRFRGFVNPNPGILTTANVQKVLSVGANGDVVLVDDAVSGSGTNNDWSLTGNANTTPTLWHGVNPWMFSTVANSNFIGTTTNQDVIFRRNSIKSGVIGESDTAFGTMALANRGVNSFNAFLRPVPGQNTAIGWQSLAGLTITTGDERNTSIGVNSLGTTASGTYNVAIGFAAGNNLIDNGGTGGRGNVYIGTNAGALNQTFENNKLYINSSAPGPVAIPLIGGDFLNRDLTLNVNNTTPTSLVTINGGVFTAATVGRSGLRFNALREANTAQPSNGKVLSVDTNGIVVLQNLPAATGGAVAIANGLNTTVLGNGATLNPYQINASNIYSNDGTLLGNRTVTMNDNSMIFNTGNTGRIYIGNDSPAFNATSFPTTTGNYRLYVEGGILSEKAKVALKSGLNWADYVFANDYKLMSLTEIESFVKENKHLPGIESADELVKNGLDLGDMQAKQMGKIEELTLYAIEQDKKLDKQGKEIEELKVLVKTLLEKK